jgi:hypothetical protein
MPQAPRTSSATEVLAGLVDRVTFHNSENGFCVLRVKARGQRDLITLVGHAAMISAGEFVLNDPNTLAAMANSSGGAFGLDPATSKQIQYQLADGKIRHDSTIKSIT